MYAKPIPLRNVGFSGDEQGPYLFGTLNDNHRFSMSPIEVRLHFSVEDYENMRQAIADATYLSEGDCLIEFDGHSFICDFDEISIIESKFDALAFTLNLA